ncbi:lantibiotic immunity ABC transporter MutG family permease subunit [Streptococcus agalactiae]|uniref:lantibiotic immunity ABC transporter MutG family permease subunit n=1 Tax=Streptococcus agalactiae TaxID=1311 RepID=UPI0002BA40A8|nr:lantibiotic immunity ABC transporter MutG family permease subunit [Streptococcus agalactiae]EPU23765.1 lantibiotic transport permease [Streptococcus agalactiae LMG 14838]EPU25312.1 lantibiotic transport permease [Streptococcus agalactiae LMG 14609]QHO93574.1 lantibiotic immunity ABC transporter MutG family permease subunit [Streptococcus agalactiae]
MKLYLRSSFLRIKNTSYLLIHILAALLFPLLLFLYWNQRGDLQSRTVLFSYFQIVGVLLPFVASIVCIQLKNLEESSGKYKYLLGYSQSNYKPFFVELVFLWMGYCIVLMISITVFVFLLKIIGIDVPLRLLILNSLIYIIFAYVTYMINHIISYIFSTGVALGISMVGVIVAAFCETSLGDKVWFLIPWAWLLRISDILFTHQKVYAIPLAIMVIISITILLLHMRVFQNWNQDSLTNS